MISMHWIGKFPLLERVAQVERVGWTVFKFSSLYCVYSSKHQHHCMHHSISISITVCIPLHHCITASQDEWDEQFLSYQHQHQQWVCRWDLWSNLGIKSPQSGYCYTCNIWSRIDSCSSMNVFTAIICKICARADIGLGWLAVLVCYLAFDQTLFKLIGPHSCPIGNTRYHLLFTLIRATVCIYLIFTWPNTTTVYPAVTDKIQSVSQYRTVS